MISETAYRTVLVLVFFSFIHFSTTITLEEDLTITWSQKVTLDKFRETVSSRLKHDYMKQDIYLIRWLRAQKFNLKRAEEMLLKNMKWRKENQMDTIHDEDFSDMEIDYPYQFDVSDKQEQPVSTASYGEWNIRNAVVTGRANRLLRYLDRMLDEAELKIRGLQMDGKNVTRFVLILNLQNFHPSKHSCATCTTTYSPFLHSFENHFPQSADKIILINIPPVFEFVLRLLRSNLSPETQKTLHIFGRNKQQWQKYLLDSIDENQLTPEFGGTKGF